MSNVLALQTVSSSNDDVVVQGISSLWSVACTCNETVEQL
jgi:hypothetical protein